MTDPETKPAASDSDDKRRRLVALAIQIVASGIAFAVLRRTPDARLRGPRWLWRVVIPLNVIKSSAEAFVVVPLGSVLFFLFGRRRPQ